MKRSTKARIRTRRMIALQDAASRPTPPPCPTSRRFVKLALGIVALMLMSLSALPPQIVIVSGNNQTGNPGAPLSQPFVVQVLDEFGNPAAGVAVTFTAPPGGGFEVPDLESGIIDTIAGGGNFGDGGPAVEASLSAIEGVAAVSGTGFLACGPDGGVLISDSGHSRIRRVGADEVITTAAGNGELDPMEEAAPALETAVGLPAGVACDASENLYFADSFHRVVRLIDAASGTVTTVAGNGGIDLNGDGGAATAASLGQPHGVALDPAGNLWVTVFFKNPTSSGSALRRIDGAAWTITTPLLFSQVQPGSLTIDASGRVVLTNPSANHVLRYDPATDALEVIVGTGASGFSGDGGPATAATLSLPQGVAFSAEGDLFIVERGNARVRRVDASGVISTYAGNGIAQFSGDGGPATSAGLLVPSEVAVDVNGILYVSTSKDGRVRRVFPDSLTIDTFAGNGTATFAGDGGPATAANLNTPRDAVLDSQGRLVVADSGNGRIRRPAAVRGLAGIGGGASVRHADGAGAGRRPLLPDRSGAHRQD